MAWEPRPGARYSFSAGIDDALRGKLISATTDSSLCLMQRISGPYVSAYLRAKLYREEALYNAVVTRLSVQGSQSKS